MPDKITMKQRWQTLSTTARMLIVFGGVIAILFGVAVSMSPPQPPVKTSTAKPGAAINLNMPGSSGHDLAVEKLSASVAAVQHETNDVKSSFEQSQKVAAQQRLTGGQSGGQSVDKETLDKIDRLTAEVAELKEKQKQPSLDEALPPMDTTKVAPIPLPQRDVPKLRIMVGDAKEQEVEEEAPKQKQTVFIPAGSMFDGVLLNGMDAPTSGVAQKNPVPALIRIKSDAILPNRYRYDVRECFVLVSGFGELSSERVQLQTVVLSCVRSDGGVIESKLEGYVVGEDGMVGMRGKVISKQGSLIAKSFVAGFASGIGQAMTPMPVQALNTNPGATTQYQTPPMGSVLSQGTAQGVSQSAMTISKFYLDMAKQMFPVIEVGANRHVSIIIQKGIEMNMLGEKKQ